MKYTRQLNEQDLDLIQQRLNGFVPDEIYDIHVHPYHAAHFRGNVFPFLDGESTLGTTEHVHALRQYMRSKIIHGLYFGMPHKNAILHDMNEWVAEEVQAHGTTLSRALRVTSPQEDPSQVAEDLRSGKFIGLKVYHCYASRPDTMNALPQEYIPEWMWEILNEVQGVLLLHIVRDGAMDDAANQKEIRRLCLRYPRVKLILAHVARSFNYRNARSGLNSVADLDNVVVDTSAVTESESFAAALKILGPRRVLWGSDYPVSEMRGRCVTIGNYFYWLHPEVLRPDYQPPTNSQMTLVGIESLITLREACDDAGLTSNDIRDLFLNNALRFLGPHLPAGTREIPASGSALWQQARETISGGTGLLSKRAELYDPEQWPSYFSRASGCEVWDLNGKRYIDFAGGIGAVLLGYADPDVNAAVLRRLSQGSYCTLVNPQEVELAQKLLSLHPWAGKVRYARGGGEAMTMAVRIARAATGKSGIAFCGYHGWQDWYLAANLEESDALDGHLLPGLPPKGVPRELKGTSIPFFYNDMESFQAALAKLEGNLAAVVMEPLRSQEPKDQFLERIAEACRAKGAVFIIDEITSGFRFGYPGASTRLGIEPDLAVYAKAISNGIPFAAIVGRQSIMEESEASFISSSYWTDGLGTAAALATLNKMERLNVFQDVWQKGLAFTQKLKEICERYPACNLRVGSMASSPTLTFQLGNLTSVAKKYYIRSMADKGFLVSSVFYLMLAHREEHFEAFYEALDDTLSSLERLVSTGQLHENPGNDTISGFARLA